jgi:hypothetical protein
MASCGACGTTFPSTRSTCLACGAPVGEVAVPAAAAPEVVVPLGPVRGEAPGVSGRRRVSERRAPRERAVRFAAGAVAGAALLGVGVVIGSRVGPRAARAVPPPVGWRVSLTVDRPPGRTRPPGLLVAAWSLRRSALTCWSHCTARRGLREPSDRGMM